MAKKSVKKKVSKTESNAAVASFLSQLQDRVTSLAEETGKALASTQEQIDRAWTLNHSREAVASKNRAELEKFGKNVTDSLYALRDNTQKAFLNVANDIQSLKTAIQLLNERTGQVESRLAEVETKVKVSEDFRKLLVETFRGM